MTLEAVPKTHLIYNDVADELSSILFQPDVQAFRIILSAIAAHNIKPHGYPPVWLMLIGPSGSGKTTQLDALNAITGVHRINEITPKTFLSGFKGNGKDNSLLTKLGSAPIVTMKDFTTILSMRYESKSEIMGQLREIYDGFYRKATGSGDTMSWKGRLTLITCCTPAIDRDRLTFRVMGDRFMEIRWSGPSSLELAQCIIGQSGAIDFAPLQNIASKYIANCSKAIPKLTPKQIDLLANLAHLVAILRTPVTRDEKGYKIVDVGVPESPTRISQAITSVVLSSAALDHANDIRQEDIDLAIRMAQDSIPHMRLHMLKAIGLDGNPKSHDPIANVSRWIRERTLEDLEVLGLIQTSISSLAEEWYVPSSPDAELAMKIFTKSSPIC